MSTEGRADAVQLFVRFPPSWGLIDPLRQYVDAWVRAKIHGEGTADRACMVVQELVENAIKYGDPVADAEVEIRLNEPGRGIDVVVTNKAHKARISVLEREFQKTKGESAREAFTRALQRLQKLPDGSSMLGLARIAMESTIHLDVKGDRVTITARVGEAPAPARR